MSANEGEIQRQEMETPTGGPCVYNPVTVDMNGNSLGAIFLGILSCMLLIGWMRSQERYHALLTQLVSVERIKLTIPE